MGAWGFGSFDNDDALDWVNDFECSGVVAVDQALTQVCELADDEYLEAPEASNAIAAAEFVAAARDHNLSRLPEEALAVFTRLKLPLDGTPLLDKARRAVERVLRQSELEELWDESSDADAWRNDLERLLARLK